MSESVRGSRHSVNRLLSLIDFKFILIHQNHPTRPNVVISKFQVYKITSLPSLLAKLSNLNSKMYSCPPMPPSCCPPDCASSRPKPDPLAKYYREIGTAMAGNQLIIRMEREKGKSKKSKEWDPPCDCDVVEIQRPTSRQGPKILKGIDNNRILFRVESKPDDKKKINGDYQPQAVYYEVGQCKGGRNTNNQCRTVTIYPVADAAGSEEVHTDRLTEGDENVFMLRVKKKPESSDQPRRHVELELRTPKPPCPIPEELEISPEPMKKVVLVDKKEPMPEEKPKKEVTKRKGKRKN